jgi:hypothetical protein
MPRVKKLDVFVNFKILQKKTGNVVLYQCKHYEKSLLASISSRFSVHLAKDCPHFMESKLSHRHVPIEDGIQLNNNMNEPGSQSRFDPLIIDLDFPV